MIDVKTKRLVAVLKDEKGREVHSEKMVEINFKDGTPVRVGDQFGLGRVVPEKAQIQTPARSERQPSER